MASGKGLASRLNRRITFQARGNPTDTRLNTRRAGQWTDHASVAAEVQDVLPSRAERLDDSINIGRRPARIRIRYRTDITGDMRIIYGPRVMQIVSGPVEIGVREGLELMAEEFSSGSETA